MYALFENETLIGGPQSVDPGGWTEVQIEEAPPGTPVVWDFEGSVPTRKIKVLSPEEVSATEAAKAKAQRNRLLAESDWTDMASAKGRLGDALYDQWQVYRQALRDIPQQIGFPLDIVWPTPPSTS
jgi:hypothetical protein